MIFKKYSSEDFVQWDNFILSAKNQHFFFFRKYMDYHSDRFKDFSLMIYDDDEKLICLMPANIDGDNVYSHQGLTFGGFIVSDSMKTETMVKVLEELVVFLKSKSIKKLIYKSIPYIYHKKPSEEDRYALFKKNANLFRRDVSSTIYLDEEVRYSKGRKWSVNKAKKENIEILESSDFKCFWNILEEVLQLEHGASPVHSIEEIELLAKNFPKNIRLFLASHHDEVVAGALIYENENIVHTQYLANSLRGREVGALDFLIDNLIKSVFKDKKYFDFGISNENQGKILNAGLIAQKEGFGARPVVHDFYELIIK